MTEAGISVPQSGPPQHDLLVRLQNPNHAQSPTLARAYMVEAAATITDLRGQVERLTKAYDVMCKSAQFASRVGEREEARAEAAESRASRLEGVLEDVWQATKRHALKIGFDHSKPKAEELQQRLDEIQSLIEAARSLPVNAVSTSSCDCNPWPDKCPYCGGQPGEAIPALSPANSLNSCVTAALDPIRASQGEAAPTSKTRGGPL